MSVNVFGILILILLIIASIYTVTVIAYIKNEITEEQIIETINCNERLKDATINNVTIDPSKSYGFVTVTHADNTEETLKCYKMVSGNPICVARLDDPNYFKNHPHKIL